MYPSHSFNNDAHRTSLISSPSPSHCCNPRPLVILKQICLGDFYSFIYFLRRSLAFVAQDGVQWCYFWLNTISASQVQAILLPQPPNSWDYRHAPPCLPNFVFLLETGFLHVGQAGLELQTSGDLPPLASQSAGIIGVSHCTRQPRGFLISIFFS